MVKDKTMRVSLETLLEMKELRWDLRVNHLGEVAQILVELGKTHPKEVRKIAEEYTKCIYNSLLNFSFTNPFSDTYYPFVSA